MASTKNGGVNIMILYDKRGKDPKGMLFFIATLLIVALLSSCSDQPKETNKEVPQVEKKGRS